MANEDETLWMVFNGEIYNSPELRRYCESKGHSFRSASDGEVILHLWEMEGWQSLRRLNGIFAIAVADSVSGEVFLARDPLGVKPLFYSHQPGKSLWFASEIRSLIGSDCDPGSPDTTALAQFLTFMWVPDPRSPHRNIRSVEPGQVLTWSDSSLIARTFTDVITLINDRLQADPKEFEAQFAAAVQRQLMADVPLAIMASGGIDSSLIWQQAGSNLARAYTIDWRLDGGSENLAEDTAAVSWLQNRLGTPVTYVPVDDRRIGTLPQSGDLFADPAFGLVESIAYAAAADGHKVLFSGQGGDELLAGYRRHGAARVLGRSSLGLPAREAARLLRMRPSTSVRVEYLTRMLAALSERDSFAGYMTLCSYSSARERAIALDCTEAEVGDDIVWDRHSAVFDRLPSRWSMLRKACLLDLSVYLPGLGLAYTDRAGMAAGVEIRVPFLDLDLLSWALALPDHELVRRGQGKLPARQLAERTLGHTISRRPKRGFGVPRERLAAGRPSGLGFRQSQYFALATGMLDQFMERQP